MFPFQFSLKLTYEAVATLFLTTQGQNQCWHGLFQYCPTNTGHADAADVPRA